MPKPTIAIVGRPNVGKSTLFNRLAGYRKAIVDDEPGVTRDRNFASLHWGGREYLLIDTGGFEPGAQGGLAAQVREQVQVAMEEADLILFLVSVRDGLSPLDAEIAQVLRRQGEKAIFLVVNQVDSDRQEKECSEFFGLGLPRVFLISAEQGRGLGELLDAIGEALPYPAEEEARQADCTVAIVGRPNVGKSSLLNRILGQERAIVSEEPGTTRDSLDTLLHHRGRSYLFTDTAGIRRPSKIVHRYERYSVLRAIKALERAEIALILLDATAGVTLQDSKIAALAEERGCSCLLLLNKWDLMPQDEAARKEFSLDIREKLKYLHYAPILFISARTGRGVKKILPEVERIAQERKKKVQTSLLNRVVQQALEAHQPPIFRGRPIGIYYATQLGVTPPTFLFFTNQPEGIPPSYRRYLSNQLRDAFEFRGAPIRLTFRKRE
ncbi:MAG: ribosome biogenesis GTPase Der [candidate division NC10 bacterium]|nr:ribosome biogenesis GTPase Der [candidate division NC10 bacterium]